MDSIFTQFITKSNIKRWFSTFWERYSRINKMIKEIKDLKSNINEDDILDSIDKKKKIKALRIGIFCRVMWTTILTVLALPFILVVIALLPIMFILFLFLKLLLRVNEER